MTRAVRPATGDDAWAIHETARESWHAAYDEILGPDRVDEVVDDWYAIGDLESAIDGASGRADVAFLIAESTDDGSRTRSAGERSGEFDRECAGFAHAVPWPEDSAVGYLARLYVSPDLWGEGIGTRLLTRLEADLKHAFDRLRLAVLAANDVGISFYESAGFERVATRENDLAAGLEEYVYERPIATEMRQPEVVADPDDVSDPLGERFRAVAALNDNDLEALADGFPVDEAVAVDDADLTIYLGDLTVA